MSFTNQQVFRSNEVSQQLRPLPNLAVFLQKWFGVICGPVEEPVSLLIWGMCLARHKMKVGDKIHLPKLSYEQAPFSVCFTYTCVCVCLCDSLCRSQHVIYTSLTAILSMLYIHHPLCCYHIRFRGCHYCSHWGPANCCSFVLGHGASQTEGEQSVSSIKTFHHSSKLNLLRILKWDKAFGAKGCDGFSAQQLYPSCVFQSGEPWHAERQSP